MPKDKKYKQYELKTVPVGARISEEIKIELEKIAEQKEWTISHLISKILKEYINNYVQNKQLKK